MILEGVGPIDNRPSTNQLHQFAKKNWEIKIVTHDIYDMWHTGDVNSVLKF